MSVSDPVGEANSRFRSTHYMKHNEVRLRHLASLGLDLDGRSVLEVGAGVGDHTLFFLDRGCNVLSIEPRQENCELFAATIRAYESKAGPRAGKSRLMCCDIESIDSKITETFDIVYAYGLLYHVADPEAALEAMARRCGDLLLLETCVSYGSNEAINPTPEPQSTATQSFQGLGCRPTRPWVFNRLKALFPYVYATRTQPPHDEFPLSWRRERRRGSLHRAVFVASRRPIANRLLLDYLPMRHSVPIHHWRPVRKLLARISGQR